MADRISKSGRDLVSQDRAGARQNAAIGQDSNRQKDSRIDNQFEDVRFPGSRKLLPHRPQCELRRDDGPNRTAEVPALDALALGGAPAAWQDSEDGGEDERGENRKAREFVDLFQAPVPDRNGPNKTGEIQRFIADDGISQARHNRSLRLRLA